MKIIKNPNKHQCSCALDSLEEKEESNSRDDGIERKLVKNPETGHWALRGPKITKEKVERDFPTDCCRDAIILRRSVGLE